MSAEALYGDELRRLAALGRADRRLDRADGAATADNPLCGDRITMEVALDGDRIAAVGHAVRGCLLCEAAVAVVAATAVGRPRGELVAWPTAVKAYLEDPGADAPITELAPFAPARRVRSRHRCVTLAFEALARALA